MRQNPRNGFRPMIEGNFTYYGEGGQAEEAFRPDMARELDSPAEILAETFCIGITVAAAVYQWHLAIVERTEKAARARSLGQVVSYLLRPHKNRKVRDIGMAFSLGFARDLNGLRNEAHAAAKFGCSRALISYEKRKCDKALLPAGIILYGKSAEACKKYKQARLKVLGRNGKHK